MRFARVLVPSLFGLLFSLQLPGQDVVAARAGVVHFTEGAVYLDDQALERKPAAFPVIKEGATLRTEKGRAEVLLTPGVFIRLDENSAIRMVKNSLADPRVQFLQGAVIVDSADAAGATPLTVSYRDFKVQFSKPGIYRLDSDTGVLQAYSGEAHVVPPDGRPADVDASHEYFFDLSLETNKMGNGPEDEFYDWAKDRNDTIEQENQIASDANADPDTQDPDPNVLSGGLYSGNVPAYGIPGYPSTPVPGGNLVIGSTLFNPFLPYGPGSYVPYPVMPLVIIGRPLRYGTWASGWPHGPTTVGIGTWHPTHWPTSPTHTGITPGVRPVGSSGLSRPVVTSHAPISVPHIVGHR